MDVASVKASPCNEPHSWQIFHKSSISLDEYSDEAVITASDEICTYAIDALFASLSYSKLNEHKNSDFKLLDILQWVGKSGTVNRI